MKGKTLTFALALLLALSTLAVLPRAKASPTAEMYFNPSHNNGTLDIDDDFYVSVMIKNFADLFVWQVEVTWDKNVLTMLPYTSPLSLADDIFDVLAPATMTMWNDGLIDNTNGIMNYVAYNLKGVTVGVTGTAGVGYKLMVLHFKVVGYGTSPIHFNKPIPPYAYPTQHTYYANSTIPLRPNPDCTYTDGDAVTKAAPSPYGPEAKFIFWTDYSGVGETVNFDATTSKSGFNGSKMCPIEEYRWDWNGDLVWDNTTAAKTMTHAWLAAGDYNVTLEVYAPGTTVEETDQTWKIVHILPPAEGVQIDITSNADVFYGYGPDTWSNAFAPQALIRIKAKVTYNGEGVEGKLVGFEVRDSTGACVTYRVNVTDSNGETYIELRIPSMPAFGDYLAIGVVEVAGFFASDTMPFYVGWIVEIESVTPVDDGGLTVSEYHKGDDMYFDLILNNHALTTQYVVLTVVVYDALGVPLGQYIIGNTTDPFPVDAGLSAIPVHIGPIEVPSWAFISPPVAKVYANSFTDLPMLGGVPTCPEESAQFLIKA